MTEEIKKLSEIMEQDRNSQNRKKIDEILDQPICITDFHVEQGSFGEYLVIECDSIVFGKFSIATGAKAITRKLLKYCDKLPFQATFVKTKSASGRWYYDLI